MSLGERVKRRRELLKLTQGQLARRSGVNQGLLSRIESGDTASPGATVLKALAIALRCSTDWLLEMYDDAPDDISALLPAGASP